jgi:hypothetical protein
MLDLSWASSAAFILDGAKINLQMESIGLISLSG